MPHGSELKHIQNRTNLPTDMTSKAISKTISPKIRAQSFFSARVAESNILDRFREITDSYMTGKIGRDEARNLMLEYARANNRDDGTRAITNLASSARLNLIIDQNASMARAVGDYERMYSPANKKVFPYVIYHASVGSRKPRSEHQRYDGMIFEKDDPWLKTHWPPWDFNCHCRLENCTDKKAHKTPDLIQPPTPADKVTVDSKSGFSFDPAHAFERFDLTSIPNEAQREDVAEQLEDRYGMAVSPDGKYASKVSTDTTKIEQPSSKVGKEVQMAIKRLEKSEHIETVDFSYMPEKAAKITRKAANRVAKRVEQYGLDISYVGTRFHSQDRRLASGIVIETRRKNGRTEYIFNETLLADPNLASKMEDAANTGYHPKSINSVVAYVDHDIAHLLFYKAKMDEDEIFMKYIRFLRRHRSMVGDYISDYAATDDLQEKHKHLTQAEKEIHFAQELLAECWASVKNTWFPPKIHKFFATMLEKRLKQQ